MKRNKIVWVDEEINSFILRPFIDELQDNGFVIIKINRAEDVINTLRNEADDSLSAIIVDIIMPPGEHYSRRKTDSGLRTGYLIIDDIMKEGIFKNVPIIVFSSIEDPEQSLAKKINNSSVFYFCKKDYFVDEFVRIIKRIINNNNNSELL